MSWRSYFDLSTLSSYKVLRPSPVVNTNNFKALVLCSFVIFLCLEKNHCINSEQYFGSVSRYGNRKNQTRKLDDIPWVHNSIEYTQRLHYPNLKDRLTQRSISYYNIIDKPDLDSSRSLYERDLDSSSYHRSIMDQKDLLKNNYENYNSYNPDRISSSNPQGYLSSKFGSKGSHLARNELNPQKLGYLDSILNHYRKFEGQNKKKPKDEKYIPAHPNSVHEIFLEPKKELVNYLNNDDIGLVRYDNSLLNTFMDSKKPFALNTLIAKGDRELNDQNKIDPSKTASDRIGGPLITSHVVTTSIHPWIYPFLYVVAEPYMSFLVFIIITIVECLGIFIGYKLDFLDLRPTAEPSGFVKASSATIIDLCADVTCSNPGETCPFGLCKCGSRSTCEGEGTGAYCDATNNQCKCAENVDACTNSGETCQSGVCKCGTGSSCVGNTAGAFCDAANNQCKCSALVSACTNSGETCSSSGTCLCGTTSSCAGLTTGSYCDAANNVCKCSATVSSCSGTSDTCTSGVCKCGTNDACSNSGETCSSGSCMCGTASTCVGQASGAYCDATNNVCKCSSTVDACSGTSDTCTSGLCKCGTNDACSNSGETCSSGSCMCGTATTCVGQASGAYCDATNNVCKCSSTVDACSGTTDTCTSGVCKCGTNDACSNSGETCSSGSCLCGTAASCVGQSTGAYCDAANNVCKCSSTVAACSSGEECSGGSCVCK